MNEPELGQRISAGLDEGLSELSPEIIRRLGAARAAALACVRPQEAMRATVTTSESPGSSFGRFIGRRVLAPGFVLVVLAFAVLYWQQIHPVAHNYADNAELDAAVLTDELPVTAYLDQGFEVWLYHETPPAERH